MESDKGKRKEKERKKLRRQKRWKRRKSGREKKRKYTHIDILHNKTNILKLC